MPYTGIYTGSEEVASFTCTHASTGQAKERPHLLVLAFPLYALAA